MKLFVDQNKAPSARQADRQKGNHPPRLQQPGVGSESKAKSLPGLSHAAPACVVCKVLCSNACHIFPKFLRLTCSFSWMNRSKHVEDSTHEHVHISERLERESEISRSRQMSPSTRRLAITNLTPSPLPPGDAFFSAVVAAISGFSYTSTNLRQIEVSLMTVDRFGHKTQMKFLGFQTRRLVTAIFKLFGGVAKGQMCGFTAVYSGLSTSFG